MTAPEQTDDEVRRERLLVVAVALGSLLIPLNSTMLVVALPELARSLGSSVASTGWLLTAYLIAMASLQPVTGRLGDRLGPRPMILTGLALFGACSLGAALAPNMAVLLVLRVGQAVTGAMFLPNGTGVLRRVVHPSRLGLRMGAVGATLTAGAAMGPVVGGIVSGAFGWRAIFLVNIPAVGVALAVAWRAVPDAPGSPTGRFDLPGAAGLLAILSGAALVLVRIDALPGWVLAVAVPLLVGASALFVRAELRHGEPVLEPRLFSSRAFSAAGGSIGLSNLAMYVTLVAVPVLLDREGWAPSQIGLVLSAMSLPSVFLAPFGGRLADRLGSRRPALAGMTMFVAGLGLIAATSVSSAIVVGLLIAGMGLGLSGSAVQLAAVMAAPAAMAGSAAGVISTCRYAGSITGTALLAGPLALEGTDYGPIGLTTLGAAVLAAALSLRLPGRAVTVRAA